MRMINPFSRFYDTEITVYELKDASYGDSGERELLGSVICDIQPYEGGVRSKPFGLDENRSYKLFCDKNSLLKNGRYIMFAGEWYMIVSLMTWSFGMTAVVRSVDYEH